MKYKLIFILLSAISVVLYHAMAHSDQPVAGKTGAPSENNCSQCHTGSPINTEGKVAIQFSQLTTGYEPNKEYPMEVIVEKDAFTTFGFEVVAIQQSTNKTIGTFVIADATTTQLFSEIVDGETRNYIGHTKAGTKTTSLGKSSWNFIWKSPSTSAGDIVFYVASIAANGKNTRFNDWVYTSSLNISEGINATENLREAEDFTISTNYQTNQLLIRYRHLSSSPIAITVVDVKGNLIEAATLNSGNMGNNETVLFLQPHLSGIFFVNIKLNHKIIVRKIIL